MTRWIFAAVHLLALPLGMTAVWLRGSALAALPDARALKQAFRADAMWGLAAGLWLVTGLVRAFGGLEKGTEYYVGNHFFLGKMGLFVLIVALEVLPMVGLIGWRRRARRGELIDFAKAPLYAKISRIQAWLIVLMVLAATAMARGFGA